MDDTGLRRLFTRAGQKTLYGYGYIAHIWNKFDCFPTFDLEF